MTHESVRPPLQFIKEFLAGTPMKVCVGYVNWAMDYTGNFMFVDTHSIPCREHYNILKEACEWYLKENKDDTSLSINT